MPVSDSPLFRRIARAITILKADFFAAGVVACGLQRRLDSAVGQLGDLKSL